ncbi:MAG: glycosyltransferase involved in cell wall biosynthesis [Desulforhopalus sp.]|jgi:glycosyltransferase involved in cell wall biosynthesis
MRVLLLIWNYWPGIEGGSERQARQVAAELSRRGHTCIVWTAWLEFDLPKSETIDGTAVERFGGLVPLQNKARRFLDRLHQLVQRLCISNIPSSEKYYNSFKKHFDFWLLLPVVYITRLSFMLEVQRRTRDGCVAPDLIHLHEPSWLGGFAVRIAQSWGVPVLSQEATNPVMPTLGYDVPYRRHIDDLRKKAHFIAMAPYLAVDLASKGIPNERIHLLPNGVKIPDVNEDRIEESMVLYVGNFSQGAHWKAFDVLFDAWKIVHQEDMGLNLVVLGGGDRKIWEDYVEALGCASTVLFMGRVGNPEEYYSKASVFVLPSRVEGMSNALLEAQSWGLPCVVSDIPGNTSVVDDGVNGMVVPVNDPRALAAAVITLQRDTALRKQTGKAAFERMKLTHDLDLVMDKLLSIYKNVSLAKE